MAYTAGLLSGAAANLGCPEAALATLHQAAQGKTLDELTAWALGAQQAPAQ